MNHRTTLRAGDKLLTFDIYQMPYTPLAGNYLYILGEQISKDTLKIVEVGFKDNLARYLACNKELHFDLILICFQPSFREGLILLGKLGLKKNQLLVFDIESRLEDMRRDAE